MVGATKPIWREMHFDIERVATISVVHIFDPLYFLCQYSIKYKQTSAKNSSVPKEQSDIVSSYG